MNLLPLPGRTRRTTTRRAQGIGLVLMLSVLGGCAGADDEPEASGSAAPGESVEDFYAANDVRIIVGLEAGGSVDALARVVAEYLPKYIPGEPTVVVENMPGAGSVIAANAVADSEPKDGTVIGAVLEAVLLQQLSESAELTMDAQNVNWIGSLQNAPYGLMARSDGPVESVDDLLDGENLIVGTVGPGSGSHTTPVVLAETLGLNFELVPGYEGLPAASLALQQGEVDGFAGTVVGGQARELAASDDPAARFLVVMGEETPDLPYLEGVPAAESLAPDDQARQLLRAANAPQAVARPYFMAADVPADRASAVNDAFAEMIADQEFLDDANRVVAVEPKDGDTVEEVVDELFATPTDVLEQLKETF